MIEGQPADETLCGFNKKIDD